MEEIVSPRPGYWQLAVADQWDDREKLHESAMEKSYAWMENPGPEWLSDERYGGVSYLERWNTVSLEILYVGFNMVSVFVLQAAVALEISSQAHKQ